VKAEKRIITSGLRIITKKKMKAEKRIIT